ncbi:hypothetical protein KUCAC02_036510, partial [Chaenocephalus aceratus]
MLITEGAFYSEELKNSSSLRFKSLAYDVQHLEALNVQHLVRAEAFIVKYQEALTSKT